MKNYDFLLTLTGSSAPSCRVLKNEVGDGAWVRSSTGVYTFTSPGNLPLYRTNSNYGELTAIIDGGDSKRWVKMIPDGNGDALVLMCFDEYMNAVDLEANNMYFIVRVYPSATIQG
jgi:hypothetical protein